MSVKCTLKFVCVNLPILDLSTYLAVRIGSGYVGGPLVKKHCSAAPIVVKKLQRALFK